MARDVNRYESIILDKLVALSDAHAATRDIEMLNRIEFATFVLLDCVSMFREPPCEIAVEDGFGAMVDKEAK